MYFGPLAFFFHLVLRVDNRQRLARKEKRKNLPGFSFSKNMANFEVKSFKVDENKPLFICFKQGILDYTFEAYLCLNICTISLCQMHMAIFFLNVCLCCLYPVDFKRLQCPPQTGNTS